jgi:hypothetical protein
VDASLLDNEIMQEALRQLNPINARSGFFLPSHQPKDGDETDDIDPTAGGDGTQPDDDNSVPTPSSCEQEPDDVTKRFATCYAQILFFAFLTEDKVNSLEEVLHVMSFSNNNKRLCQNLGLRKEVLRVIQKYCNGFMLSKLDYKIQNINSLIRDSNKAPLERVQIALTKFGRMSEAEVVTPIKAADELIAMLPEDLFAGNAKVLDIASKQGEMLTALMRRYGDKVGSQVYSLCTSPLAYEFTRKVYSLLSLPIEHIYSKFTSFDLIDESKPEILTLLKKMNFKAIIGNPPYQDMDGGGNGAAATPIYNKFVDVSRVISPQYSSMIIPARWYGGGRGLDDFRKDLLNETHFKLIKDYPNPKDCFPDANISGGICFFLWAKQHDSNECEFINIINSVETSAKRQLGEFDMFLRYNKAVSVVHKVMGLKEQTLGEIISQYMPYGIRSYERGTNTPQSESDLKLISSRGVGYVPREKVTASFDYIDKYNVIIGKAISGHLGETDADGRVKVLATTDIVKPNEIVTESYLCIGKCSTLKEATSIYKYVTSKFARFLLLQGLTSMNITKERFRFVPIQDFTEKSDIDWSVSVEEVDRQLYAKYGLTEEEVTFIESMIKPM